MNSKLVWMQLKYPPAVAMTHSTKARDTTYLAENLGRFGRCTRSMDTMRQLPCSSASQDVTADKHEML